jgi:tetratricopeptide (TPR) repeat protein
MTPERWQEARRVFHACVDLSAQDRANFLERECAGDAALKSEVESLLANSDKNRSFMESPPAETSFAKADRESWLGRRMGAYEILAPLGEGGMGEVFRAVRADGQYRQEVAIKVVRQGLDGDFALARFRAERQILASLDHPNIARLFDGGITEGGRPYFVMELIEGEPIDQYCERLNLPTPKRLELFCDVCGAVQYAHTRLIVHRDLKPANILVTADGVVKLLDFGIAKVLDIGAAATAKLTEAHPMTPEYASPEQVRGGPITTATDIYSLGVILYRLLTGQSPYRAAPSEPYEFAREVCETQPSKPSSAHGPGARTDSGKELDGDLDSIVLMALRKEPDRRYTSAEQLAEDIRRHFAHRPVTARQSTWSYRAGRFLARNKLATTAAVVVALTLAGGILATGREARIASAERDRAERHFQSVRHLANALIFDMDDAIANLPGSTAARKLLVGNALQYLDALAKESKGDAALQRELAGAFQKLSNIQGSPTFANLGDTHAALESYRKALAMRQALSAANPNNSSDQLALADSYLSALSAYVIGSNLQEGFAKAAKALAILEPLAKANPTNAEFNAKLAKTYLWIGQLQGGNGLAANLADTDSALQNYRKALAISERIFRDRPNDLRYGRAVAVEYASIGELLANQGDRITALENYRESLNIVTSLGAGPNDTDISRLIQLLQTRIGNVQLMNGDALAARQTYRAAVEITERLAEVDPQNATARMDLATSYAMLGRATAESGGNQAGLDYLQKAVEIAEKEVAHDPKALHGHRILGLCYLWRGQVSLASRRLDDALRDYRRSEAILEAITAADPSDVQARVELAATNEKIADAVVQKGERRVAETMYHQVLTVVEPLADAGTPNVQAQYTAADAYAGLGAMLQNHGSEKALSAGTRAEQLEQACGWFERSAAEWRRVRNPGRFSPLGFDTAGPSQIANRIALCDARSSGRTGSGPHQGSPFE